MARYYSPEFKKEVKEKVDFLSLVSEVTTVQKFGYNYLAHCPFHSSKKNIPEMQVDPVNNTFSCHSCGAGSRKHSRVRSSDPIEFYVHTRNKGFYEAVEDLAKMAGVPLPAITPEQQREQREQLAWIEKCTKAQQRFKENLANNNDAKKYLANRGITPMDIERWQLGFGDDMDPEFKNTKGRITFPFLDYNGHVVSFTGRLPWSGKALENRNQERKRQGENPLVKYLDMYGFKKGENLYGLNLAKEDIRKWKTAIIVEGRTDVISLHRHGLTHSVSTMGVALSEKQASILKRSGAKTAIMMYDGDEAGLRASERAGKILEEQGIRSYIYPLPKGMDPDDIALEYSEFGSDLAQAIHEQKLTFSEWRMHCIREKHKDIVLYRNKLIEAETSEIHEYMDFLNTISSETERTVMIRRVAELLKTTPEGVLHMMKERI